MKKNILHIITAFIFFSIIILMVIFPSASYNAAKNGLNIWFNNVLPSLLPFFIGTELLIGLGVVHFIGVLLEPIMKPIFNVPGVGSFAYAMSIASGYPMGTKITTELRNEKICTQEEGQRLLSLCSTSGPLFIIGAVAIGMFNNPMLGRVLLLSHYIGSLLTGLCFRGYGENKKPSKSNKIIINNPFTALYQAKKNDNRKLGVLLADAVRNSFSTLLIVGGFIIFFSVLTELFSIIKVFDLLTLILSPVFSILNSSNNLIKGLLSGIFEITNGVDIISKSKDPLIMQGVFTSFIISWGGFSIHAQAISFISKTDLNITPYLFAKVLHGFFASISCYIFMKWPFLYSENITSPVFYNINTIIYPHLNWVNKLVVSMNFYINILIFLLLTCLFIFIINTFRKIISFYK